MRPGGPLRDLNAAALSAGLTGFVWYAFGAVPLLVAVARDLGLDAARSSSWLFVVWFGGGVSSVALSLWYRQPIPIASTIPGLVYLGTFSGQFSFAELVGANLVAGLLILLLGLAGAGERIVTWIPLPIILGMFAGSILGYVTRLVRATVDDVAVAGPIVAGYFLGRAIGHPAAPPMALALAGGTLAILLRPAPGVAISWSFPTLAVPEMTFSLHAFAAVSLPMVVLALGLGNVQGVGFLLAQGYRVPINAVTVIVGVNSVVNGLLGGHPAIVARTGVAIVAGPDAGPAAGRYWANIVASGLTAVVALAATSMTSLMAVLPPSYLAALTGLAILSSFQDALQKAFDSSLRFGALVAFAVSATPFALAGISSAFWSILAGVAASLLVERAALHEQSGRTTVREPVREICRAPVMEGAGASMANDPKAYGRGAHARKLAKAAWAVVECHWRGWRQPQ